MQQYNTSHGQNSVTMEISNYQLQKNYNDKLLLDIFSQQQCTCIFSDKSTYDVNKRQRHYEIYHTSFMLMITSVSYVEKVLRNVRI